MRRIALTVALVIVAACAKKDEETAAPIVVPAPPAATIDLPAVAGTWDLQIMGAAGDSVLTTGTLTATADPAGWVLQLPGRDPLPLQVSVSGDSITTVTPEYESVLRKGARVQTTSVYRMVGSNLNGTTTATYRGVGADSVVMLRATGTRKP